MPTSFVFSHHTRTGTKGFKAFQDKALWRWRKYCDALSGSMNGFLKDMGKYFCLLKQLSFCK